MTDPVPTLPVYPQAEEKPKHDAVPAKSIRFRVATVRPGTQEKHYPRKPVKAKIPDRRYVKYY